MKRNNKTLWITLVFILVKYPSLAESYQCFECENCPTISEDDSEYITECPSSESFSTQEPDASTNSNSSTKNEGTDINSLESNQSSTLSSTSIELDMNSTSASSSLSPSTSTLTTLTSLSKTETTQTLQSGSSEVPTTKSSEESTTEKQKVTSSWSLFPNSIEENELSNSKPALEDRSDELFNWRSQQVYGVCYILKTNYEGHEVTKRGCGLRGQNKEQICQILGKGEPNSECEVCEGNLCNSGLRLRTSVIGLVFILFVSKAFI